MATGPDFENTLIELLKKDAGRRVDLSGRLISMPSAQTASRKQVVDLHVIPTSNPWQAMLLPVAAFPVPAEEREKVKSVIHRFAVAMKTQLGLSSEIFVQVEQSDDPEARALYNRHAPEWIPEIGLGVWPDREPPHPWSKEEFMNIVPGEKPRIPMHQVFRITESEHAKQAACGILLGFGPIVEIMTPFDGDGFLQMCTSVFLPPIEDPAFTCFPFYIPLLERKTLTSATSEQLDAWLCGAKAYIRESFEDKGILIASREPLGPILEQMGGRMKLDPEPHWEIAV